MKNKFGLPLIVMKYNRNTGHTPRIGDEVVICHINSVVDGMIGKLVGYSDTLGYCGIVLFDNPVDDLGTTAVSIPFVCLDLKK